MDDPRNIAVPDRNASDQKQAGCTCSQDPFAALPPELRPKPQPKMGGLRKVTCPGCGTLYWTNRATDLCTACEKQGLRLPPKDAAQED